MRLRRKQGFACWLLRRLDNTTGLQVSITPGTRLPESASSIFGASTTEGGAARRAEAVAAMRGVGIGSLVVGS